MSPERRAALAVNWSPPSENLVKINYDRALFGEFNGAGIGVVICNSEGRLWRPFLKKL